MGGRVPGGGGNNCVAGADTVVTAANNSHCPLDPPAPTVVLERECSGTHPLAPPAPIDCGARERGGGAGQSRSEKRMSRC